MRVVIAPDKFRGSLSATEAADAMRRGVLTVAPDATIDVAPMADGGEGTVEALVTATAGEFRTAVVTGPLGNPVEARYGVLGDRRTAVIEMAAASGHAHVPPGQRDPSRTTTRGTGELIRAALADGARHLLLGIGGSATNDGGVGCAEALGYRFLDRRGVEIGPGGGSLEDLDRIDPADRCRAFDPGRPDSALIEVACDVDNPLCGPQGASAVYGPQKGADPVLVLRLDRNLEHLARLIERDLGVSVRDVPGAGAAGGLGAGLIAFARARLRPGIELVIQVVGLDERLRGADLCLTGEGSIDRSSAFGKTAVGVAQRARAHGCPTIALAGALGPGAEAVLDHGIDAMMSLCPAPISLEEALRNARPLLERATEQAVRCFLVGRTGRIPSMSV